MGKAASMTTPDAPQPDDIAIEQPSPELLEDLQAQSEHDQE
jgi:hypothetical protein